ncbi:MAG: hypothetical protein ACTSRU_16585, partial [Candidatus Hodarchaeales archaeon]
SFLKVITPTSGSFTKSALIKGENILIDTTLYYVSVSSENEGYYLVTIFNSPCISNDVIARAAEGAGGSTRHLHKRPWEINIPQYNPNSNLHQQIVEKGKEMENKAREIANKWREKEFEKLRKKDNSLKSVNDVKWRPRTVQNRILKAFKEEYKALDDLVIQLFDNTNEEESQCRYPQ